MIDNVGIFRLLQVGSECRLHVHESDRRDPTGNAVTNPFRVQISEAFYHLLRLTNAGVPWYNEHVQAAARKLEAAISAWEGVGSDRREAGRAEEVPPGDRVSFPSL